MSLIKKNFKYLLIFILTYAFFFGVYTLLSVNIPDKTFYLQSRRYFVCALAVTVAVFLYLKNGFKPSGLLPHAIVTAAWSLAFPVADWSAFHKASQCIDNNADIAFAAYCFFMTVCLQILMGKFGVVARISQFIFGVLHTLLLIIPITQTVYFLIYGSSITPAAAMAVLQTNPAEAREYLLQTLGMTGIVGGAFALILLLLLFIRLNKYTGPKNIEPAKELLTSKIFVFSLIVFAAVGAYTAKIFTRTGVPGSCIAAADYFSASKKFLDLHESNFSKLTVTLPEKSFRKPSTIIMVIGESASRNYMSAFSETANNNTPWLKKSAAEKNFLLFKNAYSSWNQTVPTLERALTEKNQYNTKAFNDSVTIIDIAKKAGYRTYWFSGHSTIGAADTPITLVAKTADRSAWLEDSLQDATATKYDGDLLKFLDSVDPEKNNFIVFHIYGSHESYINRYPPEFTKWGERGKADLQLNYDNSLAYSDWVLEQIFNYSKEKLNLQAMVYFSDHGSDPNRKRHPDKAAFTFLRIPFFVYLSDEYRTLYPERTAALTANKDKYFTNDLMYEAMCGIFNITSPNYDESNSIASDRYKYTRETLTTMLGQKKLTEDIFEQPRQ